VQLYESKPENPILFLREYFQNLEREHAHEAKQQAASPEKTAILPFLPSAACRKARGNICRICVRGSCYRLFEKMLLQKTTNGGCISLNLLLKMFRFRIWMRMGILIHPMLFPIAWWNNILTKNERDN
jgi:hypothetical protein